MEHGRCREVRREGENDNSNKSYIYYMLAAVLRLFLNNGIFFLLLVLSHIIFFFNGKQQQMGKEISYFSYQQSALCYLVQSRISPLVMKFS